MYVFSGISCLNSSRTDCAVMISSRLCFLVPTPNISRIFVEICASRGTSDNEKYLYCTRNFAKPILSKRSAFLNALIGMFNRNDSGRYACR